MNAEQLLAHFDRIADAPDAIPRLRRFILDLAVRGKLVEQDPNDEPAEALLQRARTSKTRVMVERKIRSNIKPELSVSAGEDVSPAHWVWTHLYDFALVLGGKRLPAGATFSAHVTKNIYIRVSDMKGQSISTDNLKHISDEVRAQIAKYTIERTDLYITIAGTIGNVGEVPEQFHGQNLTENAAKIVFREIDKRFLLLVLQSADVQSQFQEKIKQMAQPKLALKRISGIRIPLPPLAEQHRIVAKVDELMALCDRLETARKEREATRDRLAVSSLARLNTPDPDPAVFQRHAAFTLDNLAPLTTRPDQIKALRQTILNLAVRGKLVEQDSNDEPAGELLERIAAEKKRMVEAGEIREPKVRPSTDESPFDIPPLWEWRALREIVRFENGDRSRNYPSGSDIKTAGVPFFSTKNISDYAVKFDQLDFITEEKFKSLRSGKMKDLDILITLRGSVGKLGLFQATQQFATGFINAQLLIIRNFERNLVRFCLTFMKSQTFLDQILDRSSGSATPQLSASQLAEVLIPLPPLAEQHRIVAKVDELMALCDRLEANLARGDETRGRLVDTLLHEALELGTDRKATA